MAGTLQRQRKRLALVCQLAAEHESLVGTAVLSWVKLTGHMGLIRCRNCCSPCTHLS